MAARPYEALFTNSSDVISVVDREGVISYISPSVRRVFGWDPALIEGRRVSEMWADVDIEQIVAATGDTATPITVEFEVRAADGRTCTAEIVVTNLLADPTIAGVVFNTRDITDRKALQVELEARAFSDALTGLPNRSLFSDRVTHAMLGQGRRPSSLAVLLLDLDGFRSVNDSLGHTTGDQLLIEVGRRLGSCVRPADTVARLGGDEFAVLLENMTSDGDAVVIAERIAEELREPFQIQGHELHVGASLGIAVAELGEETCDELLRNADLAMYRAKSTTEGGWRRFEPGMHAVVVQRQEAEEELRHVLERNELILHYQPIVDLRTGAICGSEALLRWNHPRRGLVPPLDFIPLAEETGLIVPIGEWVLREACLQTKLWQGRHAQFPPLSVSVNLSGRQLTSSDIVSTVASALKDSGLAANSLTLEVTETILLRNDERTLKPLRRLKAMGVHLALDDFGTGYSSLAYLKRFPVDTLKIDRAFIDRLGEEVDEAELARMIVRLGQGLRMTTIAEGIEGATQLSALREMGCAVGQGFYFSRPIEAESFEDLLNAQHFADLLVASVDDWVTD